MTDEARQREEREHDAMAEAARQHHTAPALRLDALGESDGTAAREARETVFHVNKVTVRYGGVPAVRDVEFDVRTNEIAALIGPSGCGKSTLIRCLNRMNDLIPSARVEGKVLYHGQNLYAKEVDAVEVRKRIGMVFQKPNPFPKSIYDNIAFGTVELDDEEHRSGRVVEFDDTDKIFTNPSDSRTEAYVTGKVG